MIKRKETKTNAKAKLKTTSKILDSVYEAAQGMHGIGLMDTITMRKFESLCKNPALR